MGVCHDRTTVSLILLVLCIKVYNVHSNSGFANYFSSDNIHKAQMFSLLLCSVFPSLKCKWDIWLRHSCFSSEQKMWLCSSTVALGPHPAHAEGSNGFSEITKTFLERDFHWKCFLMTFYLLIWPSLTGLRTD